MLEFVLRCPLGLELALKHKFMTEIFGFDVGILLELEALKDTDHFTHDLAYPPCIISSRNIIGHGFISTRHSSLHFCSMARRSLSLRALSSSTIFNSSLADKSGAKGSKSIFDSNPLCTASVLGGPASCAQFFDGKVLHSALNDSDPDRNDWCFLKGGR